MFPYHQPFHYSLFWMNTLTVRYHCGLQPNSLLQYKFSFSNKDVFVFRELKFEKTTIVGWWRNKFKTWKTCCYQMWDNGPRRAATRYWSLLNIGYLSFIRPGNLTVHWFQYSPSGEVRGHEYIGVKSIHPVSELKTCVGYETCYFNIIRPTSIIFVKSRILL